MAPFGQVSLYHDHPLAPAEGEAPEPDDAGLGHCRADHPEHLDRDRAIGIDEVRAVEIDRIDVSPATNFSRSTTFELSTSSAFSSSAVKVRNSLEVVCFHARSVWAVPAAAVGTPAAEP
jgi:hypothetical protein